MAEWNDVEETVAALSTALNTYDWTRAQEICSDLIARLRIKGEPYPEHSAKKILGFLRRKRRFATMERVADAFLQNGQTAPQIVRQYAQAMIDQGNFTASQLVLKSIAEDFWSTLAEKAEANGLIGRIHKQLYVNANSPSNVRQRDNLRHAVQRYYDTYVIDPRSFLWHGINCVALLARAARDGLMIHGFPESGELARQIRRTLQQMGELAYWDLAIAIEDAVALDDWEAAYKHLLLYEKHPRVDAFEIASLQRQLIEVWQVSEEKEPGSVLLPALRAALLQREGGSADVDYRSVTSETNIAKSAREKLERVFGDDSYHPLDWYKTGLTRCKAVARVESVTGHRIGTGFLVRASDFFPGHTADQVLLLTNAHVISPEDKPYFGAHPPQAVRVIFEASRKTCTEVEVVWSSPPDELDATFVSLKTFKTKSEICPLTPPANPFNKEKQQRVYIIGYPLGGKLSFSLQDSVWLDTDERMLHYRTPTDPGSSGSPVFDQHYWTLVGLHRSGRTDMPRLRGQSGTHEANAGVAIGAIQAATRDAARSATP